MIFSNKVKPLTVKCCTFVMLMAWKNSLKASHILFLAELFQEQKLYRLPLSK